MKIEPSLVSFVAISKRRKQVLSIIKENQISQPEIMKLTGMYKAHTSRTLTELKDKKLVICCNPQDRAFKFYKIASLSKKILEECQRISDL